MGDFISCYKIYKYVIPNLGLIFMWTRPQDFVKIWNYPQWYEFDRENMVAFKYFFSTVDLKQ